MSDRYLAWPDGYERDDARPIQAYDASDAAQRQAELDHRQRDGWEWSWPIEYTVEDSAGKLFTVEVDREMSPSFVGGRPKAKP